LIRVAAATTTRHTVVVEKIPKFAAFNDRCTADDLFGDVFDETLLEGFAFENPVFDDKAFNL